MPVGKRLTSLYKSPVYNDAIMAFQIFDIETMATPEQLGVPAGNGFVLDLNIIAGSSANGYNILSDVKSLASHGAINDIQFIHRNSLYSEIPPLPFRGSTKIRI